MQNALKYLTYLKETDGRRDVPSTGSLPTCHTIQFLVKAKSHPQTKSVQWVARIQVNYPMLHSRAPISKKLELEMWLSGTWPHNLLLNLIFKRCIYLKDRDRKILHLLVNSLCGCNGAGSVKSKLGARSCFWLSHIDSEAQALGSCCAASPSHVRKEKDWRTSGTESGTDTGCDSAGPL